MAIVIIAFSIFNPFPFTGSQNAYHTDDDEWDAQQLSHVEWQGIFKTYLVNLGKLNEKPCGENQCETKSEEKTCSHFL